MQWAGLLQKNIIEDNECTFLRPFATPGDINGKPHNFDSVSFLSLWSFFQNN